MRNIFFIKWVQFFTFGCVIVDDKFKAVEWIKHPIKIFGVISFRNYFNSNRVFVYVAIFRN